MIAFPFLLTFEDRNYKWQNNNLKAYTEDLDFKTLFCCTKF